MLVDCQTCPVRDVHCADCMVTALTVSPAFQAQGSPTVPALVGEGDRRARHEAEPGSTPLDRAERRAVSALVAAGLVSTATANAARAVLDPVVPGVTVSRPRTRHAV